MRDIGPGHYRYDHQNYPKEIHVECPRCGKRALAEFDSSKKETGISGAWILGEWQIACLSCPYRSKSSSVDNIGGLYYRATAGKTNIWAWNAEHLSMIIDVLEGKSIAGHKYEKLYTYLRKEWLRKSNRPRIIRALKKMAA